MGNNNELIEIHIGSPSVHYIRVKGASGEFDCQNKYRLNIAWIPDAPSGGQNETLNCTNAIPITLGFGGSLDILGQLNGSGSNNITRYTCAPGEVFNGKEVIKKKTNDKD